MIGWPGRRSNPVCLVIFITVKPKNKFIFNPIRIVCGRPLKGGRVRMHFKKIKSAFSVINIYICNIYIINIQYYIHVVYELHMRVYRCVETHVYITCVHYLKQVTSLNI